MFKRDSTVTGNRTMHEQATANNMFHFFVEDCYITTSICSCSPREDFKCDYVMTLSSTPWELQVLFAQLENNTCWVATLLASSSQLNANRMVKIPANSKWGDAGRRTRFCCSFCL